MALKDLLAILVSIGSGVAAYHLCQQHLDLHFYWNLLIAIGCYVSITILIHTLTKHHCAPFQSGSNPKHLIVIVSGYIAHFECVKGLQDSFKQHYSNHRSDINDDIMVYLARNNCNGFFCYSLYKTNDGIHRGGMRLCNEIKSILRSHPSIDKLSLIGCSLGGLYTRYALKCLLDASNINTIHGRNIQLLNFISLASPHLGIKDWVQRSSACCGCCSATALASVCFFCSCNGGGRGRSGCCPCCGSLYSVAQCVSRRCCLPPTLKQLLLLDERTLLVDMATNDEYLAPLQLFENRVCFGNAKYDTKVSCESALLLYGANQRRYGAEFWDKMESENNKFCIEELRVRSDELEVNDDEDEQILRGFERLRNEVQWKKIIVAWNQNKCARFKSHRLLAAPPGWYHGCQPFLQTLHENFKY